MCQCQMKSHQFSIMHDNTGIEHCNLTWVSMFHPDNSGLMLYRHIMVKKQIKSCEVCKKNEWVLRMMMMMNVEM